MLSTAGRAHATNQLTPEHVAESFPGGGFTGHWGKTAAVAPNDFLAVPYPHGGEVQPPPFDIDYNDVDKNQTT